MSPFLGATWFRKPEPTPTRTLQDGLFQIGCQAYHILVRDSNDTLVEGLSNDTRDRLKNPKRNDPDQLVVLIPTSKATNSRQRNFVSNYK